MRTTVNLDDELFEEARRITGMEGRTAPDPRGVAGPDRTRERPASGPARR